MDSTKTTTVTPRTLTFLEHAQELRRRLILSLSGILLTTCVLVAFYKPILAFICAPLLQLGYTLHFLAVHEAFFSSVKACFFAALTVSAPLWLSQVLLFISPALERGRRVTFFAFLLLSITLLVAGFAFSYFVLIPVSLRYLLSFNSELLSSLISLKSYLEFFLTIFFSTAVGFQLPLVLLFLNRLGVVERATLARSRRIAFFILFALAAVLTPPDVVSQIGLGVPLYLLYELSLLLMRFFGTSQNVKESR